jgi:type IV pilus assembly protein PilY1
MPSADSRTILTHNGDEVDDGGSAFRWNSLSEVQRDTLRRNLSGDSDEITAAAQRRLNYLRGDTSDEQRNGGNLRDRADTVLGDIVNSAPAFVGAPALKYPDSLEEGDYSDFVEDFADRTSVVYVNANDGALHGFNAKTGKEVLAYVPNAVFPDLYRLTDPRYSHRYFVDGSPTVGDAYFDPGVSNGGNKQWHTVLVSGLNKGGQAIFALDITDPDDFSESNTDTVLWEFSDADDTSGAGDANTSTQYALGDSFSQPAIVRLHNGQWAAVFGNGYNNTRDDGHRSSNGDAVLYLLDIGTGAVIRKISTRTGSAEDPSAYLDDRGNTVYRRRANGLTSPSMVDEDGDRVVDYVYAGDLFGNLWKFDLRSSDPADWDVAFDDGSGNPRPLFTACAGNCVSGLNDNHQPITARPRVGRSPDGRGMMIYFGTGKYLASIDVGDESLQSLYGIIDSTGQPVSGRGALQQQSILTEMTFGDVELRITSEHQIGQLRGWYLDFDSPEISGREGERLVQTPLLRGGRLIFNTLTPTTDSCGFGGSSWLMELNAYTGGRLLTSPFDVNGDGYITKADLVSVTIDGREQVVPSSGIREDNIRSAPTVVGNGNDTLIVSGDSSGGVSVTIGSDGTTVKRQSWRQLR